jgi:hypothetical protein
VTAGVDPPVCASRQRNAETVGESRESVAPPTVAECDGDRHHPRPVPRRDVIEIAGQLGEEIVGIQFLDDRLQECARPGERRGLCREHPHRGRTKRVSPSASIELLFGPDGLFAVPVEVGDERMDLAHGCSSTSSAHSDDACRLVRRA